MFVSGVVIRNTEARVDATVKLVRDGNPWEIWRIGGKLGGGAWPDTLAKVLCRVHGAAAYGRPYAYAVIVGVHDVCA